jgi:antitoxin ParD1/3/4
MAAMIKARVASGEYATESEVVRDGLRALLARDADEVAKSYDEYAAGSSGSVPAEEVLARLRSSFENRRAKSEKR